DPLGQVGEGVQLDGIAVPAGTTLLSPATVRSGEQASLVHLGNGSGLVLAPRSQARLERAAGAQVRVAVLAGSVAYRNGGGPLRAIARDQVAMLGPAQGGPPTAAPPIGQGARVDQEPVGMCHPELDQPTPASILTCHQHPGSCEWQLIYVPPAEVNLHLQQGDVIAKNNDLGLDDHCRRHRAAAWWPWAAAGAVAIIAGFQLHESGHEEPVTPSRRP
ncbi:MAG TPA: hypothetical protein VGV61_18440, partial [Thermoanaerobaculia bacterium]|nr:hypothetical protein [Thermoanaerobaculia bacterium]